MQSREPFSKQDIRDELDRRKAIQEELDRRKTPEYKINQFEDVTGVNRPSYASDIAGGMLHGLIGVAKSVPNLADMVPESDKKYLPYRGSSPSITDLVVGNAGKRPVDTFDAYKAMGTTDQPFYTPQGAAQLAGELFTPGIGLGESIVPAAKLIGKGVSGLGNFVKNQLPFIRASKNLQPLEEEAAKASEVAQNAEKSENSAKFEAVASGVNPTEPAAIKDYMNNQKKLSDLHESLSETPTITPKNVEESQANVEKTQLEHETANKLAEDTTSAIEKHLNKGAEFDVRAANKIEEVQKGVTKEIGSGYKQLEDDFATREVPVENESQIKQKTEEMHDLIRSGEAQSKEMNAVLKDLSDLSKEEPKTAKDYLHALQSVKQYAREAQKKSFKTGMNREERTAWEQRYDELNEKADELSNTLESNINPEDATKLKSLNSRWRNEVVPLYKNKVYQGILKNGQMPDNIVKSLRGNKSGNVLIKNIIKNDPELLKNVVGQRYARKASSIHEPNETMNEYLERMPELNSLKEQHSKAQEAIRMTKQRAEEAKLHHENISKGSEKRQKIHTDIQNLQDKIAQQDKIINKLKSAKERKNISLEEKTKAEKEYKKALEIRTKARRKLMWVGGTLATTGGVPYAYHKIHGLLSNNIGE